MAIEGPKGQPAAPKPTIREIPDAVSPRTEPIALPALDTQASNFSAKQTTTTQPPAPHGHMQAANAIAPSTVVNRSKVSREKATPCGKIDLSAGPITLQTIADAQSLYLAMRGLGTNEEAVYAVLENRTGTERDAIEEEFNRRYGATFATLQSALNDDFSGNELSRALEAFHSGRTQAPPVGSAAFEDLLDQSTQSTLRQGNICEVLFDGQESFTERNRLIRNATQSIYLQSFIFNDDETGWDLARLLVLQAQEGIDVRVIYDGIGSMRSDPEMFNYMRENGVQVMEYGNPLQQFWDVNDRWHEKHLIVDQKVSIEGGMNIANEYALGGSGRLVLSRSDNAEQPWRDVDVRLEGPIVEDTVRAFRRNWKTLTGDTIDLRDPGISNLEAAIGSTSVRFVQHRPEEDDDQNTRNLYLAAIRSATKSVTIENAYFLPPAQLRHALVNAARRGVDVRIMTNSRESNDIGIVSDASRYFYDDLIEAGAKIYEKHGGTLHAKTMTVDGSYSVIGSVNLNGRSQWRDSESLAAIQSEDIAQELESRFKAGTEECKEITAAILESESFLTNLSQWAIALLAPTM